MIVFIAFRTSKFIKVSRGEDPAHTEGVGEGDEFSGGIALEATFKVAALFLSSSSHLHLVVRISRVSARSFFSVASLANSRRQVSHSTFRFSCSNSSGESAKVFLFFVFCLLFRAVVGSVPGRATTGCCRIGRQEVHGTEKRGETRVGLQWQTPL